MTPRILGPRALASCASALAASATMAHASENGASVYLLGSGGPGAAVMPPVQGVFLNNEIYTLKAEGGGSKAFPIGGGVVADLDIDLVADFATLLWVPTTDLAGGVLALGIVVPIGQATADASAVITGPRGGSRTFNTSDSDATLGDPLITAMWGWKKGNTHIQLSGIVNIPAGDYREDQLANLAFHRWAGDVSLAATWLNEEKGWDVSGKAGLTFNGENDYTQYTTGTELHLEGAVEKKFNKTFSAGLIGYHFQQLSGDHGPGAVLGPFKGEVTGVGATAAYNFVMANRPATLRLSAASEFDAVNRPEGQSLWLTLSVPIHMRLPPGAGR